MKKPAKDDIIRILGLIGKVRLIEEIAVDCWKAETINYVHNIIMVGDVYEYKNETIFRHIHD